MSYINDVRLVGELLAAPELKTSARGNKYAILKMRTGRPVVKSGKTAWVFSEHRVICFKQDAQPMLEKKGARGVWLKVMGELGYLNGGNTAQIVVNDDHGSVGLMFSDVWPQNEITDEEWKLIGEVSAAGTPEDEEEEPSRASGFDPDDEIPF